MIPFPVSQMMNCYLEYEFLKSPLENTSTHHPGFSTRKEEARDYKTIDNRITYYIMAQYLNKRQLRQSKFRQRI